MKFIKYLPLILLLFFISCKDKQQKIPPFNNGFSAYVNSFTTGIISRSSTIKIHFTRAIGDSNLLETMGEDLLTFDPDLEGRLILADQNTLEFIPNNKMKAGQVYTARLEIGELIELPDSLEHFDFGFQIVRPDFEWGSVEMLATPESQMDWYKMRGVVIAADEEEFEDLAKMLTIEIAGRGMEINWQDGSQYLQYVFEIDSIKRINKAQKITINIDRDIAGTDNLEDRELELPGLGDFKFLGYSMQQSPSSHIRLSFSDPIDGSQNLDGLITLGEFSKLRFEVENTAILVFPPEETFGNMQLDIFPGIKNILSYKFKGKESIKLEFLNEKPQIKILGDGNIMPDNDNLSLPFQAISLKAIDIKVVKVSDDNLLQFLQNNDYSGQNELYRVGEVVATEKMSLSPKGSLKQWNSYSIDLSKLIQPEAGALYRVYLSFTKEYALYDCVEVEKEADENDDEYWYYDDYYYDDYGYGHDAYNRKDYYFSYPRGYRWKERNNPCHVSYYHNDQFVTRNILSTNLGLIVKSTQGGQLDFTVTDMVENKPVSGADVTLYNYQGRELEKIKTDGNGWAELPSAGNPYFVIASKDEQKTYLKIQGGEALSLSNFDVGGSGVEGGLKGFVYGERGVWRPGDTIFLGFILEDETEKLPEGHPIHFKLTNPRGMVVDQQVAYKHEQRIYTFATGTTADALTGNYTGHVRIGDRHFSKQVKVETVKPNRLKVDLDFEDEILVANNSKGKAKLAINWLTGIPAGNAKVDITATIRSNWYGFEKHPTYVFNDPLKDFRAIEKQVFEGTVDADGKANIDLDLGNLNNAPGMLKARFVAKAFEGGGDFSTEYLDKKIAPYNEFIGIEMPKPKRAYFLETDQDYDLKIKTLDAQGNPIGLKNLEVKVYKVDWHWWYNSERENLARFVDNEITYLVSKGTVNTVNGKAVYKLKVNYPNWGRFLIRVTNPNGGHSTGQMTYFDWPSTRQGERPQLAGATMLSFSTDKEKYEVGEEIITKIPVGENTRMLITVESGTGILSKEWVTAEGNELEYRIKATADMSPNVYISASLLQPHSQTTNDRPMRLFGVVPVEVYDPKTKLQPIIETKEKWRPETKVKVKVSENNGQAMTYTLAVVDDGLLNLTRFKTPDPWSHFYAKEALGVKTWDMYNDVLGAFGGKLEQVFAIGGDEALNKAEKSNLNRFVPMVRFLGPFELKSGKSTTHEINIPNYVGSVRVMVVAADEKNAVGSAEKSVKVSKPLMVLTSLPRVLNPGDEVTVPITVFAMEDNVRNVSLSLKTEGDVNIVGEASKNVRFTKNGEKVVDFKIKVPEVRGEATVRIEAKSGKEKAYDEVKLRVRLPNPPISEAISFVIMPGEDTTIMYNPIGVDQSNTLTLEASSIPIINLNHHLHRLFGYPYGCTEQTISRAFPTLYLEDIMELTDNMKSVKRQNVNIALQKIYERQHPDGSISYWSNPSYNRHRRYVTSYAGHFMIEAKQKGFQIADGVLERWKKFQQSAARNWKPLYSNGHLRNDLDQSYRLYTLAVNKSAEVGAMNRMRELKNLRAPVLWQLAASYIMIGQKEEAARLAQRAREADFKESYGYSYFGDQLRNKAIALMVINELGLKSEALKLGREVAKDLNREGYWYTTHDLAFGLIAIAHTYGEYAKKSSELKWSFKAGKESFEGITKGTFQTYEVSQNEDDDFAYTIRNNSEIPLNFASTSSGTPIQYDVAALSSFLNVGVSYDLPDGASIDETSIKQGQDFVATVTISRIGNAKGYENMALSQLFPTGWEIINTRLLEIDESSESTYQYKDIRDDRVYTFFDLDHRDYVKYKVRLNATYAGRYWLPPVEASDMYNGDIKAIEPGKWVEVVR